MIFENTLRRPFRYTYSNATLMIIALNVLVYLFLSLMPGLKVYLALNAVLTVKYHMVWQPFTYMFVHGNFSHLFFNMLGLFFFGIGTEKAMGSKEFVLMYFVCGIVSGICSLLVYYLMSLNVMRAVGLNMALALRYTPTLVGASGAIYSMLLAYAVIFPRSRIFIWGIIPVPAPILVLAYAVIELGSQFVGSSNVAHLTHLFGFGAAWLYFVVRMGIHPIRVWREAYR